MTIRKATPEDFNDILLMLKAGITELGEEYKESCLLNKIAVSYYLAPCFLLVVNDNICGMAGLTVKNSSWSGNATLMDYMFYIKPEHRDLDNLGGLVEKSKEFARENSLPLRLEFISGSEKVRKRLFDMHGFEIKAVVGYYD